MDITQLGEKLGDIKIGDIEGGLIVTIVNGVLDPEQHVTSITTGLELKALYASLSTELKNQLDKAIRFENDPATMVRLINAVAHLETQRNSLQAHMESSKVTYILLALAGVVLYNYWQLYNYHLEAMDVMGADYKSNMISFVGELLSTIEKAFFSSDAGQ